MSRKFVSIEVELNEDVAYEVLIGELLAERQTLLKKTNHIADKAKYLAAIEVVLDYYNADWRKL